MKQLKRGSIQAVPMSDKKSEADSVIKAVPFGGGAVNDTIFHLANPHLPFGGRGNSGMGKYHGKYSFDTFTHEKSILHQTTCFDFPFRYPSFAKAYPQIPRQKHSLPSCSLNHLFHFLGIGFFIRQVVDCNVRTFFSIRNRCCPSDSGIFLLL